MNFEEVSISVGNNSVSIGKEPKEFKRTSDKKIGISDNGSEVRITIWYNSKDEVVYTNIYKGELK